MTDNPHLSTTESTRIHSPYRGISFSLRIQFPDTNGTNCVSEIYIKVLNHILQQPHINDYISYSRFLFPSPGKAIICIDFNFSFIFHNEFHYFSSYNSEYYTNTLFLNAVLYGSIHRSEGIRVCDLDPFHYPRLHSNEIKHIHFVYNTEIYKYT